ncbi:MAG: amine oxidase flavin-containing [Ilumatobacteraceae bacterium]|nr:amine oxidase flavin-containing [Ilumatobacteraceae bacterium]
MRGKEVVIVGGGPCGLACARELIELGRHDMLVLESASGPGGLASSIVDPAGFTWDRGGHVVFSHYGEFDRLLADVMGDDVEHHDRSSFVHIGGSWVPYPMQNNLHRLPPAMAETALTGLISAQHAPAAQLPSGHDATGQTATGEVDFDTWMRETFGEGIVDLFMRPYNEKVWAQPARAMGSRWMAERVSTVDWRQAIRSVITGTDDVTWGPNNTFAFPSSGGTGEIYRRAAATIDDHIRYDTQVSAVDPEHRTLQLGDGQQIEYGSLVWTGALDRLVQLSTAVPDAVAAAAGKLVHNSVTVVGIGYHAPLTDDRSWLYFPDPDVPFYRATNFAKYAANNVPGGRTDQYCSWMTEIASSPWKPLDACHLGERVDAAIRRLGLVADDAPIASVHIDHVPYGYPVPSLGRDDALATIQPFLMEHGIVSRGRFGAWRYELGNMDHAVKMGIDAAHLIAEGRPEQAWSL